ncbi:thioredoxin domain-containing protein [Motiliproteus sp. MSK22-1]|uniref:thioredoxin domain-containing protein n=1 Tax=Motiliproteus sp. MSK22-1 TaxID=1897630 RepID=UPI0009767636|nr:thioredoxin domain-containing protein [Motiliproteus sp. MSK22-1]OMH32610.1 hypothetical protein BGP75_13745 [Motiliproteus sp. MSK22-1]
MARYTHALALVLGFLCVSTVSAEQSTVIRYDGHEYQGSNLPAALRQKFYELELETSKQKQQIVDQYILNRYLQDRAKAESKDIRVLQQELLQVSTPSDEELKQFYDANKARIPAPFEQVKAQISEFLRSQRVALKQGQLMKQIQEQKGYSVEMTEPSPPVFDVATAGYPSKGNPKAKVTLVEFADYQCPHCKKAGKVVNNLLKKFGDQLQVVYRDFPINSSGISRKVAEAAVCADQQGRFWDFHDLAFERQSYLKAVKSSMLAEQLGLDMDKFNACYAEQETKAKVTASLEEGNRLGLTGTPTFFINGRQLHLHGELEQGLVEAIEEALKAAS